MQTDIRLENVCFSYGNGALVLDDITLTISQGQTVALIGHNGSGKTSLVKHLNGLLKANSGKVSIGGETTANRLTSDLAHSVALSFQNPDDQICKRKVWDEVAFGPKNLGYNKEKIHQLVNASLSVFDLESVKDDNPYDLGYSERKRVALASIIAMDTPVVVFDEPTAGLDSREMTLFKNTLTKLRKENKTAIVITHDMDFVAEQIPRVICLGDGKLIFDGPTKNAFQATELLESCNLLQPQIVRLSMFFNNAIVALIPEMFLKPVR